ncbi:MAG: NUDIX hydrolase [Faecalicoccus sp.]|nr:NUDIX hydrolase [Faecalicoccus sp.]
MKKPIIKEENVETLLDARFIRLYDLQYAPGRHYFDASRRKKSDLVAIKSDEDFQSMLADAVSCVVIIKTPDREPRLLLSYEYRYPTGQYLLSVPAGLVDAEDKDTDNPLLETAKREIKEETGIDIKDSDQLFVVNPCLFSTPGMTDESNAIVCAIIETDEIHVDQHGAVGSELFNGFTLLTKEDAKKILRDGKDAYGNYYSVYTWIGLMVFVTDIF